MPKQNPTIHDVARIAGVSTATVSNVMNNRSGEVSPETAERVWKAIKYLGYVKNYAASTLSSRASKMVGVIVLGVFDPNSADPHQEVNPFYGDFVFRLERELRKLGYAICLHAGREEQSINFLIERNVDAAIILGAIKEDLPKVLQRRDVKLILFDSFVPDDGYLMRVHTDEIAGGRMSAQYLLATRRRRLVFVGGAVLGFPNNIPAIRYCGAKAVCDEAGVELGLVEVWTSFRGGMEAARRVVELNADAVVASADITAAGLVRGLSDLGVRVPDDVAVMGYDNLPFAEMVNPPLSTVDQGLQEKVEAVAQLVQEGTPGTSRVIFPKLVLRKSA